MAPDRTSTTRGLLAALVAVAGFLGGRRAYETLVGSFAANGAGAGISGVLAGALYVVFAAGLAIVVLRIARDPATLAGQLPGDRAPLELVIGFCLGSGLVAATLALELLLQRAAVTGTLAWPSLTALGTGLAALGAVAVAEEFVFRFGLLRVVAGLTSWPVGALLSSAVFAAVHVGGGHLWPVYLATIFCFGIVACLLTSIGRSLWLPIGAHWAWDFVSFAAFRSVPLALVGPSWVVGMPYRLSAGLVMLVVMSVTAAGLAALQRSSQSIKAIGA